VTHLHAVPSEAEDVFTYRHTLKLTIDRQCIPALTNWIVN